MPTTSSQPLAKYNLGLTPEQEGDIAYLGERLTPSLCGRMDQAVAYGRQPIHMIFKRDGTVAVEKISLATPLHLVLANLNGSKDTVKILSSLQSAFLPHNNNNNALVRYLGVRNKELVEEGIKAMEGGMMEKLGVVIKQAQSEFDDAAIPLCPDELSSPLLHRAIEYEPLQGLIYGAKGVGSQGDGTGQFLCRGEEAQSKVAALLEEQLGCVCISLAIPTTI